MPTRYPGSYDDDATLRTVRDDAATVLAADLIPGDDRAVVESTSKFNEKGGYFTVYAFHDATLPDKKSATFSYDSASNGVFSGIKPIRNGDLAMASGSRVVANIMAEERNDLVQATLSLQTEIGSVGTTDKNSVEWFASLLTAKVKRPRPWFEVTPGNVGFVYVPFSFTDRTSRLQSWQKVRWSWNFGDGKTSNERDPVHVYERPGKYTVTLTVENDYGRNTLVVKNLMNILGVIPAACDVTIDPVNAIAGETVVTATCRPSIRGDQVNPVNRIEWDLLPGTNPSVGPVARVVFDAPGYYVGKVTQRTVYGNFSTQDVPEVRVVERGSVWGLIQNTYNPEANFECFSPSASAWSTKMTSFALTRDWSQSVDTPGREDNYLFSGGMHDFIGTMKSLVLYAASPSSMGTGEYNGLTDVYRSGPQRSRGWGWTSVRINTREEDPVNSKQVYVIFGRSNPENQSETDLLTVEHYGMTTKTWETMSITDATESSADADLVQDSANVSRANKPRRWRSANWGNTVYILGSGSTDLMTTMLAFKPSTKTWRKLPEPAVSGRSADLEECAPFSLLTGIYFADARRFMLLYEPNTDVWRTLTGTSSWMTSSAGPVTDSSSLIKAAHRSEAPKIDNLKAYLSGFNFDGFVVFDETSRTTTVLPYRKPGVLSAIGMF